MPPVPVPPVAPPGVAWPTAHHAAPSAGGRRGMMPVYIGTAVVILLVTVILIVVHGRGGTANAQPTTYAGPTSGALGLADPTSGGTVAPSTDTSVPASQPPSEPPSAPPSAAPSTPPPAVTQATALATLRQLRVQDIGTIAFDGEYVAQLASKSVGITDPLQVAANGTHTFRATDILVEHDRLAAGNNLGAHLVLVLSTDYGKRQLYHGEPLWVTFALANFGSASAVSSWCHRRFPTLSGDRLEDQCAVRRLEPIGA